MSTDTLPSDPKLLMRSIIQRIATGPDLSKDISRTEAHLGTKAIIDNVIDPVQVGIYFIALRMKRETMDENRGVLDAVLETTQRVTADVDEVVDIGDPYDGYNRCLPAAPFLGPLLAEFGVHVVSHGLDKVGPKYGVTARHVLEAAGVPVNLSPEDAAARLVQPSRVYLLPFNPTAENMARYLLETVCPPLLEGTGVRATKVVIWETPDAFAEASVDGPPRMVACGPESCTISNNGF